MKFVSRLFITIITFSVCILTLGCQKKDDSIRVAYFDNITHGQALIMRNQGLLEDKLGGKNTVKWNIFNAGTEEVEAFYSGDIDIGYIGPGPAISAYTRSNGDYVIIGGVCEGGALLVARKGTNISSIADLSGKKVAIPSLYNTQHILLLKLLKENGLKRKDEGGDVDVIAVKNANVANLLSAGEIDAALVPEPWGTQMVFNESAELVLNYDEFGQDEVYTTAVLLVRKDFLKSNKEAVEKVMEAHIEATEMINNNREEAINAINAQLQIDTGKKMEDVIIQKALDNIEFTNKVSEKSILEFGELQKQINVINKEVDKNIIDNSFDNLRP